MVIFDVGGFHLGVRDQQLLRFAAIPRGAFGGFGFKLLTDGLQVSPQIGELQQKAAAAVGLNVCTMRGLFRGSLQLSPFLMSGPKRICGSCLMSGAEKRVQLCMDAEQLPKDGPFLLENALGGLQALCLFMAALCWGTVRKTLQSTTLTVQQVQ